MAAACLFTGEAPPVRTWLERAEKRPDQYLKESVAELTGLVDPYWNHRLSLGGKRQDRPVGLLGTGRARSIVINVQIPLLAASGKKGPFAKGLLQRLPSDSDNIIVRQTAVNLFGPDHSTSLYRDGLRRQGLLQIFHDYCLDDRSRCASCPFPGLLKAHKSKDQNAN